MVKSVDKCPAYRTISAACDGSEKSMDKLLKFYDIWQSYQDCQWKYRNDMEYLSSMSFPNKVYFSQNDLKVFSLLNHNHLKNHDNIYKKSFHYQLIIHPYLLF